MAELLEFPAQSTFGFASSSTVPEPLDAEELLEVQDLRAREAALDIHRSWIVEAPAGSGKTGLLIQRFLKLLAFGDVQRPGQVLAITFTRKAATELRTRVLEQLSFAAQNGPLPSSAGTYGRTTRELACEVLARDRALGWRLLETPHTLQISTIDALCAQIAASRPLLSAGIGQFAPVDDARPLFEEGSDGSLTHHSASP